jgi:hypothetical protein
MFFPWPGKDPISSPEDVRMIYAGKVLENTKSFQGSMVSGVFLLYPSFNHSLLFSGWADYKVPLGSKVNMHLQPRMFVKTENAPPPDKPVEQTRYGATLHFSGNLSDGDALTGRFLSCLADVAQYYSRDVKFLSYLPEA